MSKNTGPITKNGVHPITAKGVHKIGVAGKSHEPSPKPAQKAAMGAGEHPGGHKSAGTPSKPALGGRQSAETKNPGTTAEEQMGSAASKLYPKKKGLRGADMS